MNASMHGMGRPLKRLARNLTAILCALGCLVSLAACGSDKEAGKIRVGIKFDQPGLGFKKAGTYVGFDVDVATYIADKLGYSADDIDWKRSEERRVGQECRSRGTTYP